MNGHDEHDEHEVSDECEVLTPQIVYPLAYSDTGDPAQVPDDAKFFRMKVYRGTSKRPEIVRTEAGIPRLIPLTTTPDEFRRMVGPGRYRLEPVYSTGATIENAEPAIVVIEESAAPASESDSMLHFMVTENRKLIDRMFEHSERQSAEQARLLALYAEKHEQLTAGLAEQSQKLLASMADKFGAYLTGSAKLLQAAHPAIDGKTLSPVEVIKEHEALRNAVEDLAGGETDGDDRLFALVEKSVEGAMPIVRQLIHRWMLGLSEEQAKALTGEAPSSAAPQREASAATVDFITHLNAIQKHMTGEEVTEARASIASMKPAEIEAWKSRLMACSPGDAATLLRAELAKERAAP